MNNTIHDAARDVIFSVIVSFRLSYVQIFLFRGLKPDVEVYHLFCVLWYSGQGTNLATYLHLVRMCGAIPTNLPTHLCGLVLNSGPGIHLLSPNTHI